jgi:riboflavin-specific deaminase-like protein
VNQTVTPALSSLQRERAKMRRQLPFVYLNVAMTADGKLAPANRQFVSFGSKRDRELLLELRTRADAVMSGARTVDASPVTLGPGPAKYRRLRLQRGRPEYNLRVIVSGSGTINPGAEVFKHRFSPIIILTTRRAGKNRLAKLRDLADEVKICGEREIDFIEALRWLRKKWQVTRLLCEGGGEVNGALFHAGLVHEVYVTVCPLILGGRTAPTLADGNGVEALAQATQLELKSAKRADAEMYLIYRIKKTDGR